MVRPESRSCRAALGRWLLVGFVNQVYYLSSEHAQKYPWPSRCSPVGAHFIFARFDGAPARRFITSAIYCRVSRTASSGCTPRSYRSRNILSVMTGLSAELPPGQPEGVEQCRSGALLFGRSLPAAAPQFPVTHSSPPGCGDR